MGEQRDGAFKINRGLIFLDPYGIKAAFFFFGLYICNLSLSKIILKK